MKKIFKLTLIILSLALIFTFITSNYSYADIDVNNFDPYAIQPNGVDSNTVTKYTNRLASALTVAGIVVAVLCLMIVGLKFIMGSATEKAEYKKTLVPIVIGIAMIALITSIVAGLYSVGNSLN